MGLEGVRFDERHRPHDSGRRRVNGCPQPGYQLYLTHNRKPLIYHGWADQLVPPDTSISHYEDYP